MTKLETAMKYILPERRMRLSRFDALNDPFELMSMRFDGPRGRAAYRILRDHWFNRLGIICMGKHWSSPVMWAHYADNHSGVCLGFDVEDDKAKQMLYQPERLKLPLDLTLPYAGLTTETIERILTTKYSQWSYEEEWRVWSSLEECAPNGSYYLPFGPSLELKEIIVGARCKKVAADFDMVLGCVDKPIRLIKARPAFETFKMVRQMKFKEVIIKPRI
jgi:hypothetical protein